MNYFLVVEDVYFIILIPVQTLLKSTTNEIQPLFKQLLQ